MNGSVDRLLPLGRSVGHMLSDSIDTISLMPFTAEEEVLRGDTCLAPQIFDQLRGVGFGSGEYGASVESAEALFHPSAHQCGASLTEPDATHRRCSRSVDLRVRYRLDPISPDPDDTPAAAGAVGAAPPAVGAAVVAVGAAVAPATLAVASSFSVPLNLSDCGRTDTILSRTSPAASCGRYSSVCPPLCSAAGAPQTLPREVASKKSDDPISAAGCASGTVGAGAALEASSESSCQLGPACRCDRQTVCFGQKKVAGVSGAGVSDNGLDTLRSLDEAIENSPEERCSCSAASVNSVEQLPCQLAAAGSADTTTLPSDSAQSANIASISSELASDNVGHHCSRSLGDLTAALVDDTASNVPLDPAASTSSVTSFFSKIAARRSSKLAFVKEVLTKPWKRLRFRSSPDSQFFVNSHQYGVVSQSAHCLSIKYMETGRPVSHCVPSQVGTEGAGDERSLLAVRCHESDQKNWPVFAEDFVELEEEHQEEVAARGQVVVASPGLESHRCSWRRGVSDPGASLKLPGPGYEDPLASTPSVSNAPISSGLTAAVDWTRSVVEIAAITAPPHSGPGVTSQLATCASDAVLEDPDSENSRDPDVR